MRAPACLRSASRFRSSIARARSARNSWPPARRIAISWMPNARPARRRWRPSEARLRDARGETGFRGERLKIIDPGIVPERPSSPNLPLNIAVALLAGLVLPILYLTLEMSFQGRRAMQARGTFRAVAKARDE